MGNIRYEKLACLQDVFEQPGKGCIYDQGVKSRTVWVRVPPPLLVKVLDLQGKCECEEKARR